jgi:transcriptional regulator with XRE-family HTH domain
MDLFDIGERVRKERKLRKLTQEELGDLAGVSRVRINHLETGAALEMGIGNVLNVLNALNLDLKMTDFNQGRPTLDDLREEQKAQQEEPDDSPSM